MNNVVIHDDANLKRLYNLAGNQAYKPATYTCIKEFTDSFPQKQRSEFLSDPGLAKPVFKLDDPYPRIYNNDYKKTILTIVSTSV